MSSSALRLRAVPVAVAALLVLGACTTGSEEAGEDPVVVSREPSPEGSPSSGPDASDEPSGSSPEGPPEPSGSGSGPDRDLTPLEQHQRVAFLMPSQNVACLIEEQGVSCDIRNTRYQHTVVPAADCVEPTVELYRDRPEWTCSRSSRRRARRRASNAARSSTPAWRARARIAARRCSASACRCARSCSRASSSAWVATASRKCA